MASRNLAITIALLALAGLVLWFGFFRGERLPNSPYENANSTTTPNEVENNSEPQVLGDNVRLLTPRKNETIGSPLVIKGEARGWYFEGSFPVKLIGPDGKVLAAGPAQAKGEWMTSDWVPFEATLNFVSNVSGEGKLVLEKDNPSGLPQYDDNVTVPVKFTKSDTMVVKAYFAVGDGTDCSLVAPIERTVPKTTAVANAALNELLKGLLPAEKASYRTNIPVGTKVQKLEIRNGTAYVDFNSAIEQGGGACSRESIISQVTSTLKQFSTVKNVVISVDGRTEDILQP